MYFGSVRFFRHLILTVVALLIIVPITICIILSVKNSKLEKSLLASKNEKDAAEYYMDNLTSDEWCDLFIKKGFDTDQLISSFNKYNINLSDKLFSEYYSPESEELSYQKLYPSLYVTPPSEFVVKEKTVYLTFDDGPSANTRDVLNILDKYNIKATFFVVGNESDYAKAMLKEIVNRGHTIGIHSYSHDYKKIYSSVNEYLADFEKCFNYIYTNTGVKPTLFRFPGGSINDYNRLIYKQIIAELGRRGFVYTDWNVSGEDASVNASWTSIYDNIVSNMKGKSRAVVLLHDGPGKQTTVTVVEDVIKALLKDKYTFSSLSNSDKPITFGYID